MKKYFIDFLSFLIFFLISALVYTKVSAATAPDQTKLLKQGEIHSCLAYKFDSSNISKKERNNAAVKRDIQLSGTCDSPTGCSCMMCWGLNSAVAAVNATGDCATKAADVELTNKQQKKLEANNYSGYGSLKRFQAKEAKVCNGILSEAAKLVNVKPGCTPCNIVKNDHPSQDPARPLAQGPVSVTVNQTVYIHILYDFSAVYPAQETTTVTDLGAGEGITGESHSQKLGEIVFTKEDFENTTINLQKKCKTLYWDPYGRVFDAVSLEPISYREITLIDNLTGEPTVITGSNNFDLTGEDGLYNIMVDKEGNYKLNIGESTIHDFVANPKLSPYWSKIYSDLYFPDNVFYEKTNIPTHRDIALQPKNRPYRESVAQFIAGSMKSQSINKHIVYSGRNTFPMAKICLKEADTGKLIGHCVNADSIGEFTLAIPIPEIPAKKLILVPEKVDLNNPALYESGNKPKTIIDSSAYSATNEKNEQYAFEPILSHIEGYIYGSNGNKLANINVSVKLSNNGETIFQTKTDNSGLLTIYKKDLPYLEYYLEYTDSKNKITKLPTSEFVKKNRSYIDSQKIDLMQETRNNKKIANPTTENLGEMVNNDFSAQDGKGQSLQKNFFNPMILVIILIIFLLLIVTAGLILYIKKSKSI